MIINPVYRKELLLSDKSIRFSTMVSLYSFFLGVIAMGRVSLASQAIVNNSSINYLDFLNIFSDLISIDFFMVIFVSATICAGIISSERERNTLALVLSTNLRSIDIVIGKLFYVMQLCMLLLLSSMPAKVLVLVYSAIRTADIVLIALGFFVICYYVGSIAIYISTLNTKSSVAIMTSLIVISMLIISALVLSKYFFIFSPLSILMLLIYRTVGADSYMSYLSYITTDISFSHNFTNFFMCCLFQLALASLLLYFSSYRLSKYKR